MSPENLELASKVAFLNEAGIGGITFHGAVLAVSRGHDKCMEMVAMGDGGGRLGDRARRKSIENLIDAEDKLRRRVDRLISEHGLADAWRAFDEIENPEPTADEGVPESIDGSDGEGNDDAPSSELVEEDSSVLAEGQSDAGQTLLNAIKARYANGDIDRDEFLQMKRDLNLD